MFQVQQGWKPIQTIHHSRSPFQEIRLYKVQTSKGPSIRLTLDDHIQFESRDEHIYHNTLFGSPARTYQPDRVLVLGGGDGLGARDLIRAGVPHIDLIELDQQMITLARGNPYMRQLNQDSFYHPNVSIRVMDATRYVKMAPSEHYDMVIADFPDPDDSSLWKLYKPDIHIPIRRIMKHGGVFVTQAGSPGTSDNQLIGKYLERTFEEVHPVHADLPLMGPMGAYIAIKH